MSKIIFCYTVPETFHFSLETILMLKENGHEVILISSDEKQLKKTATLLNVKYKFLDLKRNFSILNDVLNVANLFFILRTLKPDIIIGATPKAALISMIASRLVGVKHRVYHIFGLPYETANSIKRKTLILIEKITNQCATDIIPISTSIKEVYIQKFPKSKSKMRDIGPLTVGGVDTMKFDSDKFISEIKSIKMNLEIPNENLVIGFVARLTNDKGIGDFIAMWEILKNKRENIVALVIGSIDARDNFDKEELQQFFNDPKVFHVDFNNEIEKYMAIMDVFVLPSYREGFGNVNAEASSMKIPVVSYNVTGCKDSVKDGYSGFLVEKNNIEKLVSAVLFFLDSSKDRVIYGKQGRSYVEKYFTRKRVAEQFYNFCSSYSNQINVKY